MGAFFVPFLTKYQRILGNMSNKVAQSGCCVGHSACQAADATFWTQADPVSDPLISMSVASGRILFPLRLSGPMRYGYAENRDPSFQTGDGPEAVRKFTAETLLLVGALLHLQLMITGYSFAQERLLFFLLQACIAI